MYKTVLKPINLPTFDLSKGYLIMHKTVLKPINLTALAKIRVKGILVSKGTDGYRQRSNTLNNKF